MPFPPAPATEIILSTIPANVNYNNNNNISATVSAISTSVQSLAETISVELSGIKAEIEAVRELCLHTSEQLECATAGMVILANRELQEVGLPQPETPLNDSFAAYDLNYDMVDVGVQACAPPAAEEDAFHADQDETKPLLVSTPYFALPSVGPSLHRASMTGGPALSYSDAALMIQKSFRGSQGRQRAAIFRLFADFRDSMCKTIQQVISDAISPDEGLAELPAD